MVKKQKHLKQLNLQETGNTAGYVYSYHEGSKGADEFLKKVFVGYQGATTGATTAPTNVEATGNTNSATVNAQ